MKVELQCGDTITIPDGCKATIKDGSVVFEREQKFKDGDILVGVEKNHRHNAFIFKRTDDTGRHSYYVGLDAGNQLSICENSDYRWCGGELSYATEEEKQQLFDAMKEKGLQWNAEEKRVKKIRWRAKYGEKYFTTSIYGQIRSFYDRNEEYDNTHYDAYAYFHTEEQTEEDARRVKETLRKYHEEIGE